MIVEKIKYTDFNGNEREDECYFNLTKAEVAEMELTTEGGLAEMIQRIVKAKDTASIVKVFKELILKSYGEISPDGKRFVKTNEAGSPLSIAFSETEAYSELFMKLATDTEAASAFVNGIIPDGAKQQN